MTKADGRELLLENPIDDTLGSILKWKARTNMQKLQNFEVLKR